MKRIFATNDNDIPAEVLGCLLVIVAMTLLVLIFNWPTYWVWNNVVPKFWHSAPHLTFWEVFGCLWLVGVLTSQFSKK